MTTKHEYYCILCNKLEAHPFEHDGCTMACLSCLQSFHAPTMHQAILDLKECSIFQRPFLVLFRKHCLVLWKTKPELFKESIKQTIEDIRKDLLDVFCDFILMDPGGIVLSYLGVPTSSECDDAFDILLGCPLEPYVQFMHVLYLFLFYTTKQWFIEKPHEKISDLTPRLLA